MSRDRDAQKAYIECLFPFQIQGHLPVDYHWALYSALSKHQPKIHGDREILIGAIAKHQRDLSGKRLTSQRGTFLSIRLPARRVEEAFLLAGARISIHDTTCTLGTPLLNPLAGSPNLWSRVVIFDGFKEREAFSQQLGERLQKLQVQGDFEVGKLRTIRVKRARNIGFEVTLRGLNLKDSLFLQGEGLGGRTRMGAGFFLASK